MSGPHVFISKGVRSAAGLILAVVVGQHAQAQRPFRIDDPFYRDESARRSFFDGFALTTKVSYRPAGTLSGSGTPLFSMMVGDDADAPRRAPVSASPVGGVGLSFHLEYEVAPQFDVSAVLDALGGTPGSAATLSWVSLKHYWYDSGTDYAVRLAFDPRPSTVGGGLGVRQVDLAVMLTTPLGPKMLVDLSSGMRRVRIGYERIVADAPPVVEQVGEAPLERDVAFTRASGRELHLLGQVNYHFDPSSSHVFLAVLYEGGRYDLAENYLSALLGGFSRSARSHFWGHVTRIRTGVRWNRPSYQLAPFISSPVAEWKGGNDLLEGQGRQRILFGVSLTLR